MCRFECERGRNKICLQINRLRFSESFPIGALEMVDSGICLMLYLKTIAGRGPKSLNTQVSNLRPHQWFGHTPECISVHREYIADWMQRYNDKRGWLFTSVCKRGYSSGMIRVSRQLSGKNFFCLACRGFHEEGYRNAVARAMVRDVEPIRKKVRDKK